MTFDEAKAQLTDLISNPDTAQEKALSFLGELEKDYTTLKSMSEKSETDDKRIRELQDTNQRLFLSVTGQPKEDSEDDEEKEPGIDWDTVLKEATDEGKS